MDSEEEVVLDGVLHLRISNLDSVVLAVESTKPLVPVAKAGSEKESPSDAKEAGSTC